MSADGRRLRGEATRRAVLEASSGLASLEGLDALTIGRLAGDLHMSKSGLFAHFGSKEELQLATVDHAREVFLDEVVRPAMAGPPGLARLRGLVGHWLGYMERGVFPGGCFFAQTSADFDNRPGPLRDRIAEVMREWVEALELAARRAQESGELRPDVEPAQIAFELHALALGANWRAQLFDDADAYALAGRAIEARLAALGAA
jgi:AcrR family transcriptional regulator